MNSLNSSWSSAWTILGWLIVSVVVGPLLTSTAHAQKAIPEPLQPWRDWATWDAPFHACPSPFNDPESHICYWPGRLQILASDDGAVWTLQCRVFAETWVPLPGSDSFWPRDVQTGADGESVVVVQRDGRPMVKLPAGNHELTGQFDWAQMPQQIAVPNSVGVLSLAVNGTAVEIPKWGDSGKIWLRRQRSEQAERDFMSVQVYRVVRDGIPIWLDTAVELTVSGKSREEALGSVLPANWKLSAVDSPIPVAIDEQGEMKAQVRPGKWTISIQAFRVDDQREISYAQDVEPVVESELIAFQSAPQLRLAELADLTPIDVTQTTFPQRWRDLPVYQWDTSESFTIVEKMRGMGQQQPQGLKVERTFWLDVDGEKLTYRDKIVGPMQRIGRLDVANGQQLGAVRIEGEGQLITENPVTGDHGVEVRKEQLELEALGQITKVDQIPATGWQTPASTLSATITLPPGWRMLVLFGADRVNGDWLTAWSLLDLFLLLVFSLAVFRMWGILGGLLAFAAYGLAYHEPGAPRLTWLFLLIPVALSRVVDDGGMAKRFIDAWKYFAAALLLINLVPFVALQIQGSLFPQLESRGVPYRPRPMFRLLGTGYSRLASSANVAFESTRLSGRAGQTPAPAGDESQRQRQAYNLAFDPEAKIQTGPAEPQWSWQRVECYWDGPVSEKQTIRPILIPRPVHRLLNVARIGLLIALAAVVLGVGQRWQLGKGRRAVVLVTAFLLCGGVSAKADEIPSPELLETLRQRLLQPHDAFPNAAEIASVELQVDTAQVSMTAEIHAAAQSAIPLPGRIPLWSPVSVTANGAADQVVGRRDGYLWIVLPEGVHQVVVQSRLADVPEWEWTFLLKPRRVAINATGWNVTGVGPNGVPEAQVFFRRLQQSADSNAGYDRRDFATLAALHRRIEAGLRWQIRNEVERLSRPGKAISLQLPLLPDENVLTSELNVNQGMVEVRLGASQESSTWNSELPVGQTVTLQAPETDNWVERWRLVASPVWHVAFDGLAPIFEAEAGQLVPVWYPWPGEQVTLSFQRPVAISGQTTTIQRVRHETTLGRRQRTAILTLDVESSLGGELDLSLPPTAEISSLKRGQQPIPVRRAGESLVVPVQPGQQTVEVQWRNDQTLGWQAAAGRCELPVTAANVTSVLNVPASRWVLWTTGPLMGPAVRFWIILISSLLAAIILGAVRDSPLSRTEWILLAIGLTQVHIVAALMVVGWLFLLVWRGKQDPQHRSFGLINLSQILIVGLTSVALAILVVTVGKGLLGHPEMFIIGNGSTRTHLQWFEPRVDSSLPRPQIFSISVWYYRVLMLLWSLWLASAVIRWLKWGWQQFSYRGCWMRKPKIQEQPAQ